MNEEDRNYGRGRGTYSRGDYTRGGYRPRSEDSGIGRGGSSYQDNFWESRQEAICQDKPPAGVLLAAAPREEIYKSKELYPKENDMKGFCRGANPISWFGVLIVQKKRVIFRKKT